jgi:hypothetical protein
MIKSGLTKAAAVHQFKVIAKSVANWSGALGDGVDGLRNRSPRPLPATPAAIEALRRQRYSGKQIAAEVGILRNRQSYPAAVGIELVARRGTRRAGAALPRPTATPRASSSATGPTLALMTP